MRISPLFISFRFKALFIIQPVQNFDMGSKSKTCPFSREMAANTSLLLEKPLRCHVQSHKTLVSTTVAELFVLDVL